jgi:hypothetical protein
MKILHSIVIASILLIGQQSFCQNRVWGKLLISVSESWSVKQKGGVVELSNYTIQGADPFNIILFENKPYEGKPDSLFATAWRNHIGQPAPGKTIPKWRRFYTEDGILILQGFEEVITPESSFFRQLNVYYLNDSYQACMLETSSSKNYKAMQAEWMERLQGVKQVIASGKK